MRLKLWETTFLNVSHCIRGTLKSFDTKKKKLQLEFKNWIDIPLRLQFRYFSKKNFVDFYDKADDALKN